MLKPYVQDTVTGRPFKMFYHQRTEMDPEAMPDEWIVKQVLAHKFENGKWKFLTKWEGLPERPGSRWEISSTDFLENLCCIVGKRHPKSVN